MLGLLKLLGSICEAIPAIRELLLDVVSMIKAAHARTRRHAKDNAVDSAINDALKRMRDGATR